jgi:hypothetical protein
VECERQDDSLAQYGGSDREDLRSTLEEDFVQKLYLDQPSSPKVQYNRLPKTMVTRLSRSTRIAALLGAIYGAL